MTKTKHLLVVDDEPGMRTTLAANFELEGYEVVVAESGARAVELVRERRFHAVITDMRMPGMNGLETFEGIRKIYPAMPVVLMTGFAMEGLVEEAITHGAYAVLKKPFSMEAAVNVVSRAIRTQAILIVDDAPQAADTLAAALEAAGHRAKAAYDCDSAVKIVRDDWIDVCVVDLVMPKKDGLETLDEIRAIDAKVIMVAVTGHAAERVIMAALNKGYCACLRKGFHVTDLIQTIARARAAAEPYD